MPNPWDSVGAGSAAASSGNPWDNVGGGGGGVVEGAKQVASGIGKALDAQRWGVAKLLTGESDTDKQMTAIRKGLDLSPLSGLGESNYQELGKIPYVGHAIQGTVDTGLKTVMDPLTLESGGIGPLLKATGVAEKIAPAVMKAINADQTGISQTIYDWTHWGGAYARQNGAKAVARLRGAANNASSTGANVQKQLLARFDAATKGLSDDDRIQIGKALNGEIAYEIPGTLTPVQQKAFTELRRLTDIDLKMRRDTARVVAFQQATRDLPAADRDLLKKALLEEKEPVVPGPTRRVRQATASGNPGIKAYDLVRHQATPGPAEFSEARGGTYFTTGGPGHLGDNPLAWINRGKLGGENVVKQKSAFRNPLILSQRGTLPIAAIVQLRGKPFAARLLAALQQHNEGLSDDFYKILQEVGFGSPSSVLEGPISDAEKIGNLGDDKVILDRIAGKIAKDAGHDAIVGGADQSGAREVFRIGPAPPKATTRKYTNMPDNQAEVDRMTRLNKLYHDIQYTVEQKVPRRENYMPSKHAGEANPDRPSRTANELDYSDPRTAQRDNFHVDRADQLAEGFQAMFKNTGHQVKTKVIHDTLGDIIDDPAVKSLFDKNIKATGANRTNWEKVKDTWLKVIGYPRAATVSLLPRHVANILDLAANTVPLAKQPEYFARVSSLAKKIVTATPEEYEKLTESGRNLGALSGNFAEREPFFQKIPKWVPGVGGKSTGPLAAYTQFINKLTWATDEAAKQTYAEMLVESGEAKGLEAGGLASSRIIDYEHVAPIVQKLFRYIGPFGTFRGSIPGAVLGGIARNPARAAFLNRASGGTMYGGRPDKDQHGVSLYNPTADVGIGVGQPMEYLRGSMGAPTQGLATQALEGVAQHPGASLQDIGSEIAAAPGQIASGQYGLLGTPPKRAYNDRDALRIARFFNYGHPTDLRWFAGALAAGLPEAHDVMNELGAGQFKPRPGSWLEKMGYEGLQQALGIGVR